MKRNTKITGLILAGGKSSRMGMDKGMIEFNDKTFVECVIDAMNPLVDDIIIVSDNKDYDKFGYERIDDLIKDAGPVAGLYAGLKASKTEDNLVLSCDVPLITTEVLSKLMPVEFDVYEAVQIQSFNKTMPLIARYKKQCAQTCFNLLAKGERRLRVLVKELNTKSVMLDEKCSEQVKNVNTEGDLNTIKNAVNY